MKVPRKKVQGMEVVLTVHQAHQVAVREGKCNKDCSSLKKYILLLLNQADIHIQMRNPNKLLF